MDDSLSYSDEANPRSGLCNRRARYRGQKQRRKLAKFGVQFDKYILSGFFGRGAVAQDTKGDAEDHRLVFQHQSTEALILVFYAVCQVAT